MILLTNRNRKIKFEHYRNFLTLRKNFTWIHINDVCSYRILCVCFVVASLALYLCDDSFVRAYEFSVECRGASNLIPSICCFFLAFWVKIFANYEFLLWMPWKSKRILSFLLCISFVLYCMSSTYTYKHKNNSNSRWATSYA